MGKWTKCFAEENEAVKQTADGFSCRYTVFEAGTDPAEVGRAYREAYEAGRTGGFYPAIVVMTESLMDWLSEMDKEGSRRDEIIAACDDRGEEILKERLEGYKEDFQIDSWEEYIGDETEGDEIHDFSSYFPFRGGVLENDVLLLEIPVKNPWEIIAYLPLGGWNDYPSPEEMISICKYWYEKYQAVPAAFTEDVMEFYAPKGLNGVDSLEAAMEHYAFCTDRVEQGTRTYKISELAAGLEGSDVWYFWWD